MDLRSSLTLVRIAMAVPAELIRSKPEKAGTIVSLKLSVSRAGAATVAFATGVELTR